MVLAQSATLFQFIKMILIGLGVRLALEEG
jgi:hypothetical protein